MPRRTYLGSGARTAPLLQAISRFRFHAAVSAEDLDRVHRLRYRVYCLERGFEDPAASPDGLERDEHDVGAWHFLAIDEEDRAVGTVRLIRASDRALPIERHCRIERPVGGPGRRHQTAEISRLAVSRDFRRRAGDAIYAAVGATDGGGAFERRQLPVLFMGLLREVYRTSLREGITHWYAAMERRLAVLIRRYAFDFRPVGPAVSYHGLRMPHAVSIDDLETRVQRSRADVYHYFREGLDGHPD